FWTFRYAAAYVSEIPLSSAWSMLAHGTSDVTTVTWTFWILAAVGLPALWIGGWEPRAKVVLTGLFVTSCLAIAPGFYFRAHYSILILPAMALRAGVAVASLAKFSRHA